ncbi:class Ib ribonucleoside-diphosphate reductase assembly flavoprotein NrdI [Streptococcus cuniculipharyngis]|uniref:Putative NrdI-like protein n=1 Tax=Streptococcus cuniculipharyngis TaxID=1562651 RepID=A0A5C5SCL5_9STRE|nr:class Ib ribonucleoside-diphosphate reductase assembly flavoprotein NrdI [Streptococcus cuniculipharyngis]TWS98696.1 class Ib ribonucleoside-diphosphate reductase assembly flavoprotein NrdI [Streptococcus cuniculipharyngis]
MITLVFYSLTGQCRRFVDKLGLLDTSIELKSTANYPRMTSPFILLVPSYDDSDVELVDDFLTENVALCQGLLGSGNRNFGPEFCKTARRYAQTYGLPILHEFEFNGTDQDLEYVKGILSHES